MLFGGGGGGGGEFMIINQGLQSRTVKLVTSNKKMLKCTDTPRGVGALPYMGYVGLCSPKGYVFQLFDHKYGINFS